MLLAILDVLTRFGYFSHNVFKLDGAVVKLDVDTGETIQKKLPTGLFPTEPIFVPRPGATEEEDGVVVMSGIDGGQEKGYVIIYNATTMDQLFLATGPRKTLFGVHSKFFPFTVGCSQPGGDCTPTPTPTTTSTATPTATPTVTPTATTTTTALPPGGCSDQLLLATNSFPDSKLTCYDTEGKERATSTIIEPGTTCIFLSSGHIDQGFIEEFSCQDGHWVVTISQQ